jgi:murein DD-endopeptidase MepM/ murein hydrolase activator NlpD
VGDTYITSSYGMRTHPILNVYKLHDGTDFGAACGSPVYAAASGRIMSEYYNAGYGNRIILDHGFVRGVSLQTSYNHLTSFVASPGEQVQKGELIGYAGTTGYSTGCHLHFMVYVNGYTADPVNWL